MYIKSIRKENDYIVVVAFSVANDIDIDFVCVQEKELLFKAAPFSRIRNTRNEVKALEYIEETEPVTSRLIQEHVFDSAVACDFSGEYMSSVQVLECIAAL